MQCGVSTACFYPEDTVGAFRLLASSGVPVTEVFLNTFCELNDDFIQELVRIQHKYGIRVSSLHPFSGMIEGFFFASDYKTRLADGIALYKRYFEACNCLGADKLVFHGDHEYNAGKFNIERYAEHFCTLAEVGLQYGVTLCQENVAYCRCSDPQAVHALRALYGDYSSFVLDLKQVCRRGAGIYAMLNEMSGHIRQVHISDHNSVENCLPPGQGEMDFKPFISRLRETGYDGDLIIELYRDNYAHPSELIESMRYIESFL